jgi:FtsP/CotA-like multicopper oxidase with cupredoxin domain
LVYASDSGGASRPGGGPGRGRGGMGGMGGMMETMNGWLGDRVLVSGQADAKIPVDRRAYRIRLLNGSNSRIYKLAWSDKSPVTLLGTDGGLLEKAKTMPALTLAPGQRADVLLDLSAYQGDGPLQLISQGFSPDEVGGVGMMERNGPAQGAKMTVATLEVSKTNGPGFKMPDALSKDSFVEKPDAPVRQVPLLFMRMAWFIDGRVFDMQDVDASETVKASSTHVWEFENQENPMGMAMAHPMHIHGPQFRVLSRKSAGENGLREGINDAGWQDTVLVLPGEKVRLQIRFSQHPGLFLYHCHILEHEDMGMMRNFRVVPEK